MPHLRQDYRVGTARLDLRPPGPADEDDIALLKADPAVFGRMLHGVRTGDQVSQDIASDRRAWLECGVGMWVVRDKAGAFVGLCGIAPRPDGYGMALRYAIAPAMQGRGYAAEAAAAALDFAHGRAGLVRVVAVAEEANARSVRILTGMGMRFTECFEREGKPVLVFESTRDRAERQAA